MRNYLFIAAFFLTTLISAQTETYIVDGTSYELRKEVEGTLTLLWNTIDRDYRYFAEKDGNITELLNTKTENGYQEEYKKTLAELTSDTSIDTAKVNLTLGSLRKFFNDYNRLKDDSYVANSFMTAPVFRLGFFGGITNSIFTRNPNNTLNPKAGIAFELLDPVSLPRHSIAFQFEQTFSTEEFDYRSSQFSLNYRLKFINQKAFSLFVNTKLVTFTTFNMGAYISTDENNVDIAFADKSGSSLQAPMIFGLGADIRLGAGYLTLAYQDAVSLFLNSNNEFPVDVNVGYKFVF